MRNRLLYKPFVLLILLLVLFTFDCISQKKGADTINSSSSTLITFTDTTFNRLNVKEFYDSVNLNFLRCTFNYSLFVGDTDHRRLNFGESHFLSQTYISFGESNGSIGFQNSTFEKGLTIDNFIFNKELYFVDNNFGPKLQILNSTFDDRIFILSELPDTLIIGEVTLKHELNLTNTYLDPSKKEKGKKCIINIASSSYKKINLRYDDFKLYKPQIINALAYEKQLNSYEGLLKNFKERGYLNSYQKLDKEYQEFKYISNPEKTSVGLAIGHVLNFLNKYWTDYGYQKVRVWYYTFFFFVVFFISNWLMLPFLTHRVYPIESIIKSHGISKSRISKSSPIKFNNGIITWKTLMPAFFYTTLIFFGLRMSNEKIVFKRYWLVIYLYVQYVLGLICVAYLANFIITSNLIGS